MALKFTPATMNHRLIITFQAFSQQVLKYIKCENKVVSHQADSYAISLTKKRKKNSLVSEIVSPDSNDQTGLMSILNSET